MTGLLAIVLTLSLIDLVLTLTYVMEIGLIEDNPLAREIIRIGGPALLIAWKLATTGFACGVLLAVRRRGIAEAAAVLCTLVMIWLTARWVGYIEASAELSSAVHEMETLGQGGWVTAAKGT